MADPGVNGRHAANGADLVDFESFVAARGAVLVRSARALLRDPQQAEDVVQDVLVRAHPRWAAIVRGGSPEAYLRRMIVNSSISWWRRVARREVLFAADELPAVPVPDPSIGVDERDTVLALLRRLPPKQRAVLVLRHYEGLADTEIAEILQSQVSTVRSNAHRGLAALRRMADVVPVRAEASIARSTSREVQ